MNRMPVEGNLTADEEEYWLEVGNSLASPVVTRRWWQCLETALVVTPGSGTGV